MTKTPQGTATHLFQGVVEACLRALFLGPRNGRRPAALPRRTGRHTGCRHTRRCGHSVPRYRGFRFHRHLGGSGAASSAKTGSSSDSQPLKIVPKGLRSFDEEDKDFFLELLPGPRDREGLPDTIRFWKTRIEKTDADATFAAGVMYGPSGCGKSSLLKAGLLPRLADHVLPIFIETTPSDTELRLLKILRRHIPQLAAEASLAEALAQVREGRVMEGRKVLLVLDQFEQWLHATANMDGSQLVRRAAAVRRANVQCLILVRDDFWMSTTRFMQSLEIPQVESQTQPPWICSTHRTRGKCCGPSALPMVACQSTIVGRRAAVPRSSGAGLVARR